MVKPPLRTKSSGFKVSEEEYAQLETAAQTSGQTLGEWCREAAVLGSANGQPSKAGPSGAEAQALMAELVALRAILLNVLIKTTQIYTHVAIRALQQVYAATHPTAFIEKDNAPPPPQPTHAEITELLTALDRDPDEDHEET